MSRIGAAQVEAPIDLNAHRSESLRQRLRYRHGWRWRYRDRWVLVAGDESIVDRLAPGLADAGYVVSGNMVLLCPKQAGTILDTGWLNQIHRLRRRRPIDAIVVVTRNRSSATAPFDVDEPAQRLARIARALRWAAPAYRLNVTDFGSETSSPDEAIGFTWSNARVTADKIDASLQDLAYKLADAGVVRLTKDAGDRYPAELLQHISNLRNALCGLVLQTAQSRVRRHAVHGLLFAPLFKERELTPADANGAEPAIGPQHRTIWQTVAGHSRKIHGCRVGFSLSTTFAWVTTALVGCWIGGTMLSGFVNRTTIQKAADTVVQLSTPSRIARRPCKPSMVSTGRSIRGNPSARRRAVANGGSA